MSNGAANAGSSGGNVINLSNASSFSPPGASSAYLPNLEKQYCKDYSCCGLLLPGLHDLLRHYEEAHISTSPGTINTHASSMAAVGKTLGGGQMSGNSLQQQKRRMAALYQQQQQHSHQQQHSSQAHASPSSQQPAQHHPQHSQQQQQHPEIHNQLQHQVQQHQQQQHQQQLHQQERQHLQPQQQTHHQPSTLQVQQQSPHHNPNQIQHQLQQQMHHHVMQQQFHDASHNSSVGGTGNVQQLHLNGNLVEAVSTNEVFLQTGVSQQGRRNNPTHTTPSAGNVNGKLQAAFNNYSLNMQPMAKHTMGGTVHQQQVQNSQRLMGNSVGVSSNKRHVSSHANTAAAGIDLDFMDADMIDDLHDSNAIMGGAPAAADPSKGWKHVGTGVGEKATSHRGEMISSQESDDSSMSDDDDEEEEHNIATPTTIGKRKQQTGFIDDPARRLYVMDHEEHKPFKCPVIGCDKTYKNQNGLKYHKLHGHQNQKLHENADGTFSIIDPESNEPYPDGMGFEKDKPYRCEVCGKRYKNLNGLKYHRGHSTH